MDKDLQGEVSGINIGFIENTVSPSPIVKWAGGKSKLISIYKSLLPQRFRYYYEPFVGGGALFFYLYNNKYIIRANLNDSNRELINLYQCIRDSVEELLEELERHEVNKSNRKYYYQVRNLDRDSVFLDKYTPAQRAARVLYLNKTCYNGLFRVNRKNQFNVPFGNYKNPNIKDATNLLSVSKALKTATITCQDFQQAVSNARSGDFVYFDPPYYPVSATSFFTSYTENSFSGKDQQRLAQTFRELDQRGCYVMLSNSNIEPVLKLYKDFRIEKLTARRAINSQGDGRGPVPEIVIINY